MLFSKIEKQFSYRGYECIVMFTPMGYRCGYVKLKENDKYHRKNYNKVDVICRGGITYSASNLPQGVSEKDTWYIGFDCGHSFDGIDLETYRKLYDEELSSLGKNERDLITSSVVTMAHVKSDWPIQTKEYVENELKYIVDQIIGDLE